MFFVFWLCLDCLMVDFKKANKNTHKTEQNQEQEDQGEEGRTRRTNCFAKENQ